VLPRACEEAGRDRRDPSGGAIDEKTHQLVSFALSIKPRSKPRLPKHSEGAMRAGATLKEPACIATLTFRGSAGGDALLDALRARQRTGATHRPQRVLPEIDEQNTPLRAMMSARPRYQGTRPPGHACPQAMPRACSWHAEVQLACIGGTAVAVSSLARCTTG